MKKIIALIIFCVLTGIAFAQDVDWANDIRNQADSAVYGETADISDGSEYEAYEDDEWANEDDEWAYEDDEWAYEDDEWAYEDDELADVRFDAEWAKDFIDEDEETPQVAEVSPKPKKKGGLAFPYRRFVEFGINGDVGFANNLVGVSDILRKKIVLDMSELSSNVKKDGWALDLTVNADAFFNFNVTPKWGFGFFSSASGSINATISKSFMTLIAEGNLKQHSQSGEVSVSGGIFTDVGIDIHARFLPEDKLKISLIPSMFVPAVYIPKSSIEYHLHAEDELTLKAGGKIDVYTPVYMESVIDNSSFDSSLLNVNKILGQKGFDFSLIAEYELFSWLNVGGGFTHIPLSPAVLGNRFTVEMVNDKPIIDGTGLIGGNTSDLVNAPKFDTDYDPDAGLKVMRPMRFDVFADYKPFNRNLFIIRPNIGFTVITPEEKARFNMGLQLQLNTPVLLIHASTGYEELLWQHRLWLGINLRIIEIDAGLYLSSQDFKQSFDMSGAGVTVGFRIGF
ncbi:MAG: nucleolar 14 family protein [Treponema sp.]|jgi:hypothetical protein|nr:nucleolar 14 family protein [Treponema sp.]